MLIWRRRPTAGGPVTCGEPAGGTTFPPLHTTPCPQGRVYRCAPVRARMHACCLPSSWLDNARNALTPLSAAREVASLEVLLRTRDELHAKRSDEARRRLRRLERQAAAREAQNQEVRWGAHVKDVGSQDHGPEVLLFATRLRLCFPRACRTCACWLACTLCLAKASLHQRKHRGITAGRPNAPRHHRWGVTCLASSAREMRVRGCRMLARQSATSLTSGARASRRAPGRPADGLPPLSHSLWAAALCLLHH